MKLDIAVYTFKKNKDVLEVMKMIMPTIKSRFKRVIIDIDTQRHFFLDSGLVRVLDHQQVLTNIRRTIAWARLKNIRMISTVQIYDGNNPNSTYHLADVEGLKKIRYTLRNRHTIFDATDCTDFPPRLWEQYDQIILHKRCFDPFKEPRADRILSELQANEFILIGAAAEGAVKATALGLLARHKNVTILVDAVGSYDKGAANVALRYIWAKGAMLTDTRTLLGSSCLRLTSACRYG
jgi:nicotinamidase-related amidase